MTEGMKYQGRIQELQKQLIGDWYAQLTRADQANEPAAYLMISGNPAELMRAFGIHQVYPEINALQLAVRKKALAPILKAEELGYSCDNCAYVKADVGFYLAGRVGPFGTIPKPALIVCNYVGCNTYIKWFEHLAKLSGAPLFMLDVPFPRDPQAAEEDIKYVVSQLKELIALCEDITGKSFDEERLKQVVALARDAEEGWAKIRALTKNIPAPYDAYFDATALMAPVNILRGSPESVTFYQQVLEELEERIKHKMGPLPEERFRVVFEGPPPWPYLKAFRELFARWGAVAVASTYATVGGIFDFGFRHDPARPLESIAEHMLFHNYTNSHFLNRYEQIARYIKEWSADAFIIHSVKSCRLFSAGQGDMREYFAKELGIPTLLLESDLEDPRYFSEAQLKNRVDAFFEALEHQKYYKARPQGGERHVAGSRG